MSLLSELEPSQVVKVFLTTYDEETHSMVVGADLILSRSIKNMSDEVKESLGLDFDTVKQVTIVDFEGKKSTYVRGPSRKSMVFRIH
jgi:hypothetical protein